MRPSLRRIPELLRAAAVVLLLGGLLAFALWPWLPLHARRTPPRTIVFYGFSILDHAITRDVFPAFQAAWQRRTGERVELLPSFGGSGTITNQIVMGVPAGLALLALEADATRLADAGVVAPRAWRALPYGGVVNRTPIVILVRAGNPRRIRDFADLARPGIGVVHADPLTSGAATWAILAEYGAGQRARPDDPRAGERLLLGIWRNVVAQAASARAARAQFDLGFGDALIAYEQEGLWDRTRDRTPAEIVYPSRTILTEHTLVEIPRRVPRADRELVGAFAAFLWSDTAQRLFVRNGFRSVNDSLTAADSAFGRVADAFGVDALGGWGRARHAIVDSIWRGRVLPELGR